jgi:cellulose synthase/poly-beta-1,6-N-acetylglucosamine synthase-like glycosyltransferase
VRVAVTVGVYNEEKRVGGLLDALRAQTRPPDQVVIVDDGSTDATREVACTWARRDSRVRVLAQENRGPAAARNVAWRAADADVCIFTDGDCVPAADWIERLLQPFADPHVGAAGGAYSTINTRSRLARFIGCEIAWRYRNVDGAIQVHGTYNLAVRRHVLEEVGGLDERYPKASGEDWDMTYKISRTHTIAYVHDAVVGHYHPERFWPYMRNQARRAYDRIKVYRDHPDRRSGDNYTPAVTKYQIAASGALAPSLVLLCPLFPGTWLLPAGLALFLLGTSLMPFPYIVRRDAAAAFVGVPVAFARNFAWFAGCLRGLSAFGFERPGRRSARSGDTL